jgi:hypothetical protein
MTGKWICPKVEGCEWLEREDCEHCEPHELVSEEDGDGRFCRGGTCYGVDSGAACIPLDKEAKGQLLRWKLEGVV